MINVLLVEDQTLVRQGIRSLLELSDEITVAAEACDGQQALSWLQAHSVDVVLLDVQMPVMNGIELLEHIVQLEIGIPVIALTTFDDEERLLRLIQLGVKGYLLKDVSFAQLVQAIKQVHQGESLIQAPVMQRVIREMKSTAGFATEPKAESLTAREQEILRYLAGGYSNKEIAQAIGVTEGTIKNHVSNVLSKLGVRDRTRAVIKALNLGWLSGF